VAVLYEADISGSGIASFSGDLVDHIRVHVTTMPLLAEALDATQPYEVIRVGWVALAGEYSEGAEGDLQYCFEKLWIEFTKQLIWTSVPAHPAAFLRWKIWPGGVVHVLVVS
jgi:hypothetical protein